MSMIGSAQVNSGEKHSSVYTTMPQTSILDHKIQEFANQTNAIPTQASRNTSQIKWKGLDPNKMLTLADDLSKSMDIADYLEKDRFFKGSFVHWRNEYLTYRAQTSLSINGKLLCEKGDSFLHVAFRNMRVASDKKTAIQYLGLIFFLIRYSLSAHSGKEGLPFLTIQNSKGESFNRLTFATSEQSSLQASLSEDILKRQNFTSAELLQLSDKLAHKDILFSLKTKNPFSTLLIHRAQETLTSDGKILCIKGDSLGHIVIRNLLAHIEDESCVNHLGLIIFLLFKSSQVFETQGQNFIEAKNESHQLLFHDLVKALRTTNCTQNTSNQVTEVVPMDIDSTMETRETHAVSFSSSQSQSLKRKREEEPTVLTTTKPLETIKVSASRSQLIEYITKYLTEIANSKKPIQMPLKKFPEVISEFQLKSTCFYSMWKKLNKNKALKDYWHGIFGVRTFFKAIDPDKIYGKKIFKYQEPVIFFNQLAVKVLKIFNESINFDPSNNPPQNPVSNSSISLSNKQNDTERDERLIDLVFVNQILARYLNSSGMTKEEFRKELKEQFRKNLQTEIESEIRKNYKKIINYDVEKMSELIIKVLNLRRDQKNISEIQYIPLLIEYKLWDDQQTKVAFLFGQTATIIGNSWKNAMIDEKWSIGQKAIKKMLQLKNIWIFALLDGETPNSYFNKLKARVDKHHTKRFQNYYDKIVSKRDSIQHRRELWSNEVRKV